MDELHEALSSAGDRYVAFLDRQATVFEDRRRSGLARLQLRPGDVVLDAGCGPGTDSFDIEALVQPGGVVVGVDASEEMIQVARRRGDTRGSGVEFVVGDVGQLPHPVQQRWELNHLPVAAPYQRRRLPKSGTVVLTDEFDTVRQLRRSGGVAVGLGRALGDGDRRLAYRLSPTRKPRRRRRSPRAPSYGG